MPPPADDARRLHPNYTAGVERTEHQVRRKGVGVLAPADRGPVSCLAGVVVVPLLAHLELRNRGILWGSAEQQCGGRKQADGIHGVAFLSVAVS